MGGMKYSQKDRHRAPKTDFFVNSQPFIQIPRKNKGIFSTALVNQRGIPPSIQFSERLFITIPRPENPPVTICRAS
jgi:hypothetical protein